jgi:hypothetical protein
MFRGGYFSASERSFQEDVIRKKVAVHGFRVQRLWVHRKPACHARPENIWEKEVVGPVQGMVEETNRS